MSTTTATTAPGGEDAAFDEDEEEVSLASATEDEEEEEEPERKRRRGAADDAAPAPRTKWRPTRNQSLIDSAAAAIRRAERFAHQVRVVQQLAAQATALREEFSSEMKKEEAAVHARAKAAEEEAAALQNLINARRNCTAARKALRGATREAQAFAAAEVAAELQKVYRATAAVCRAEQARKDCCNGHNALRLSCFQMNAVRELAAMERGVKQMAQYSKYDLDCGDLDRDLAALKTAERRAAEARRDLTKAQLRWIALDADATEARANYRYLKTIETQGGSGISEQAVA